MGKECRKGLIEPSLRCELTPRQMSGSIHNGRRKRKEDAHNVGAQAGVASVRGPLHARPLHGGR
jgi:hypothetical protein